MTITCWNRDAHRDRWRVLTRDAVKYHQGDLPTATPGRSTLLCTVCQVVWRSGAGYVAEIPDVDQVLPDDNPIPARIAGWVAEHPQLAELTYWTEKSALAGTGLDSVAFLHDVGQWFCRTGKLSERQLHWSLVRIDKAVVRANEEQTRQRVHDALGMSLAPQGEQVVPGIVEHVWRLPGGTPAGAPGSPKMLVRHEHGWALEVTVPASLRRRVDPVEALVGRRVEVYAHLSRSPDLTVAWGRNPTQETRLLD
jgi:hypothetical protein